jgi:hypothetical protein
MPTTTPPTGQVTTGSLYLQLKTGYGFAELKVDDSGFYSQITRAYREGGNNFYAYWADQGRPAPAYLTSGKYKFLIEKDISSYTTNDQDGAHLFPTFPYSYASVNLGSDEVYISKGACNTTGTYSPSSNSYYTVDTRSAITYDDRNNFTVNSTSGGKDSYGDFSQNIIVRNLMDENNNSILGGNCNCIKNNMWSVIGGGYCSTITSYNDYLSIKNSNTIAGGYRNKICANSQNTIGGGLQNCTIGYNNQNNTIAGGRYNTIVDNVGDSAIGGGMYNTMESAGAGFIGGGYFNRICCNTSYSVVAGGHSNRVCLGASFIGGGESNNIGYVPNSIHGDSFIGAGKYNGMYASMSFLGAGGLNQVGNCGVNNEAYSSLMFLGGGCNNYLLGNGPSMIGGICNEAVGHRTVVGGGFRNCIGNSSLNRDNSNLFAGLASLQKLPESAVIGGGQFNCILNGGCVASILGGAQNKILSGDYSSILGGFYNEIHGAMDSFILGSRGTISGWTFTGVNGIKSGYAFRGAGLITDGLSRAFNPESFALNLNFTNGVILTPQINLRTVTYGPNNLLESVGMETGFVGDRRGVYFGYSGGRLVADTEGNLKNIQIGDLNHVVQWIDYSGDAPGTKTFIRRYNPAITIGNLNHGGYENILIGIQNNAFFQKFEDATGIVISGGYIGSGALTTIPNPQGQRTPWGYPNDTWPYFQGRNVLVGYFNSSTGTRNVLYGIQNEVFDASNDNILIGNSNAVIRQGVKYLTGISGLVTGLITPTGFNGWKSSNLLVGIGQVEQGGFHSILMGLGNQGTQSYGAAIGIRNTNSGTKNYTFGAGNTNLGQYNTVLGNENTILDISGSINNLIGYYNLIQGTGVNSVSVLGDRNFITSAVKGLILGGENEIGPTTSSLAVGFKNSIFASDSNVVGSNNFVFSGSNNSNNNAIIFGNDNTSLNTEVGIFGHGHWVNAYRSYTLGSSNVNLGEASISLGYKARTKNYGELAYSSGPIGSIREGSSQKTQLIWKGITSGNSLIPQELTLNGVFSSGNYISGKAFLPSGYIWNGTLNVVASETGLANIKTEIRNITAINRNNSLIVVNDQITNTASYGSPTWGMSLSGDSTNKALAINVTGASNKIILWNVVGEFNQMFVPTSESVNRYEFINGVIMNNVIKSGARL